jgi:radical SAM protein with 4Fe4S-binding SPASM domain
LAQNNIKNEPVRIRVAIRNAQKPSADAVVFQLLKPYLSKRVTLEFTPLWDDWNGRIKLDAWTPYMKRGLYWNPRANLPCANINAFSVRPNGDVLVCGCRAVSDDLKVGTVFDTAETLKHNSLEMKNSFYQGQQPATCQRCSYYRPEP